MQSNVLLNKEIMIIEERELPKPGKGQVRIKTVLAGICGSDIHALHGLQPSLTFPRVMGHELVGIVDALPETDGLSSIQIGDRVAIDPSFRCGICELCKTGKENICNNLEVLGVHCDGGFSNYFICNSDMIHLLPAQLTFEDAVFCEPLSIATHAISRMHSTKRKKAAIIGAGPIGLALLLGLKEIFDEVIVFELLENRKDSARSIGASKVFDSKEDSYLLEDIDVVFDSVSVPETCRISERIVRRGGEVIIVGMAKPNIGFSLLTILKKELTITGTRMTTREDFKAALGLLKRIDSSKIQMIITGCWPLSNSIEGIHHVEKNSDKCIKEIIDCRE